MNKILVIYKSKYGATKKYADMLKEELSCDVLEAENYKKELPERYDCIIFAGAIYAGGIAGLNTLRKNYEKLKYKKIAILCVGASPFDEKAIVEVKTRNLKEDLKDVPFFYARGAWNESSMTFKDRALCRMLQKMISKRDTASCEPWMKALLCSQGQICDWTDKKYIIPLLEYIRT
ncbi:flavodoxin domain-containing protein [bacterium 210820-DFI.6.37]|nr:flavodoxin domain-containing protein [bacterium 210820-DFI.6.37]